MESLPRNGRRAGDAEPKAEEPERLQVIHVRADCYRSCFLILAHDSTEYTS